MTNFQRHAGRSEKFRGQDPAGADDHRVVRQPDEVPCPVELDGLGVDATDFGVQSQVQATDGVSGVHTRPG